jgi:hypothetical protein
MEEVETIGVPAKQAEGSKFEAAAVLASPGPLGLGTMGTLPLSLIAFGWIERRNLDDSLSSQAAR